MIFFASFTPLGQYRLSLTVDGILTPLPSPHTLTLTAGYLHIPHSYCHFDSCTVIDQSCKVQCEAFDKLHNRIHSPSEELVLVVSVNHTHIARDDAHEREYTFTNHQNGTYSLIYSITAAGHALLRVRNNNTGEFFRDEYSVTTSPARLAIESCYLNNMIPQSWPQHKLLHLEIVLVDVYGALVCDEHGRYEVRMDLTVENTNGEVRGYCYYANVTY